MVALTCNPSYLRGENMRIAVQRQPRQKHEVLSEKQSKYMGGRDWDDCSLRPTQTTNLVRPHLNKQAQEWCMFL
jgi:hypothetical protein